MCDALLAPHLPFASKIPSTYLYSLAIASQKSMKLGLFNAFLKEKNLAKKELLCSANRNIKR